MKLDLQTWWDKVCASDPEHIPIMYWAAKRLSKAESALEQWFIFLVAFRYHKTALVTYRGALPPGVEEIEGKPPLIDIDQQVKIAGHRVDFLFTVRSPTSGRSRRVAVECDGHAFHDRSAAQASKDRARDRRLLREGVPTLRYTFSDLARQPNESFNDLNETLKALVKQLDPAQ